MQKIIGLSIGILLFTAFQTPPEKGKWEILFDGTTTEHWRGYKKDYLPAEWAIENGTLTLTKKGGGYIVTKEEYADFELQLDWKFSEAGNSGVFFHVSEDSVYKNVYETGPECQILDDDRHPDAVKGTAGTHKAGANYDLQAPLVAAVKPAGEWNTFVLKVKAGHVQHWLNGKKEQDYQLSSPEWKLLVARSKFAVMPGYGKFASGHISLQDHGNRVWFRNIRIRRL